MRLVCPNCEAKYEVPDDAIPDTGRDVQCAACNHAWYQMRPRAAVAETAAPVAPPAAAAPPPVAEEPEPLPETPAETPVKAVSDTPAPEPAAEPEAEAETSAVPAEPEAAAETSDDPPPSEAAVEPDPEPEAPAAPAPAPSPAYAVDDSVLAILREEAEREAAARRADARPLEIQTDLGIETAPAIALAAAAPAVAADPVAAPPETAEPAAEPVVVAEEKQPPRRDLLPDVEEINSTLRPSEAATESDFADDAAVVRQRGFRGGFLTVMVAAMIAVALYVGAPTLSRLVPALEQPLTSYVAMGNDLRLSLDRLMQSATDALNGE